MALTRQNLTPLDGYQEQIDWASVLERTNRSLIRWVLGTGLLAFHLAVFTTVLLGTYTWNLITNPADLHLLSPFRIWGVAALAHALLVGGGVIGWRLFNMGDEETARPFPAIPVRTLSRPRSPAAPARSSGMAHAWARSVGSAARVNAGARRWAAAATQQSPAAPPVRNANGWPAQPGMTAAAGSTETERPPDVGEATWPESPPISTTLMGTAEHRDTGDRVVAVDHRGADSAGGDPGRTWVDNFVESRMKDKENRWSWVEAAAASWLNRRELSGESAKALPASSEPTGDAAPPAEPDSRGETSASP